MIRKVSANAPGGAPQPPLPGAGSRHSGPARFRAAVATVILALTAVAPLTALADSFPPRGNAAWIYDPQHKPRSGARVEAGYFARALSQYNGTAGWAHRITELYVYAGDMEMYCPQKQPRRCRKKDFHVYYAPGKQSPQPARNRSVAAYQSRRKHSPGLAGTYIVPVIDGTISGHGQLSGFNRLSRRQAESYADVVAKTVCADPAAAGIQFDLEPFNVSTRNGQYYFYRRIAHDFSSEAVGCVDSIHPRGRFFSIFASARHIRPGTTSASHVKSIMGVADNGYLIDSLYDLSGSPAGSRTPVDRYRRFVGTETLHMRRWADRLGIPYQFGVPAAASAHEYAACKGAGCRYAPASSATQLSYVKAAINAVDKAGARNDERFLGIAVWAWSPTVSYGGMEFMPTRPPPSVLGYLANRL